MVSEGDDTSTVSVRACAHIDVGARKAGKRGSCVGGAKPAQDAIVGPRPAPEPAAPWGLDSRLQAAVGGVIHG